MNRSVIHRVYNRFISKQIIHAGDRQLTDYDKNMVSVLVFRQLLKIQAVMLAKYCHSELIKDSQSASSKNLRYSLFQTNHFFRSAAFEELSRLLSIPPYKPDCPKLISESLFQPNDSVIKIDSQHRS